MAAAAAAAAALEAAPSTSAKQAEGRGLQERCHGPDTLVHDEERELGDEVQQAKLQRVVKLRPGFSFS